MKPLGKFVIFREDREEFLYYCQQETDMNVHGWGKFPSSAMKYNSLNKAKREARRIATDRGYHLVVCELLESETQIGISEKARVSPNTDPNHN